MAVLHFTLNTADNNLSHELVFSQDSDKDETTIFWRTTPIDLNDVIPAREIKFKRIQQAIVEALDSDRLNAEVKVSLISDSHNSYPADVDFRIYNDPEANFNVDENGVVLTLEDWKVTLRLSDVTEILSNFNFINV